MMYADQYVQHETAQDRQNQAETLKIFLNAAFPGKSLKFTEVGSKTDASIVDNADTTLAIVESKNRWGTYGTWPIEKQKLEAGLPKAKSLGVHFFFVFNWNNGKVFYLDLTEAEIFVRQSYLGPMKRSDRDEFADICYYVPRDMFTRA